ncbi:hypothetical protein C900_01194 [Fulvivirga imtechensis AK7]|uniref:GxxExxY protein n=1 Tax=Fulvivirga imtechensis AK7 TaxID=1237149 RepID=L8JIH2_9BACT|nr:GxxExxY protein [Fulvivirga imtechensis]ELR68058.1 hypothetical protein C900_01194 [Fulvivirga imtechensis AK7]
MKYNQLSDEEELIAKTLVNAAVKVHKELGPGLLERVYEVCLAHELQKEDLEVKRQVSIPIQYDGIVFNEGLRLDLLIKRSGNLRDQSCGFSQSCLGSTSVESFEVNRP